MRCRPLLLTITWLTSLACLCADNFSKEDQAWIQKTKILPEKDRMVEVIRKLKTLNPEWKGTPGIRKSRNGMLILSFEKQPGLTRIMPVVALPDLYELNLWETDVVDIDVLSVTQLKCLIAIKTPLTDISFLKNVPIERLNIAITKVKSLEPLRGKKLTYLCVNDTDVADLSIIKGMPIETLFIRNTSILDLSPLKELPALTELLFDFIPERDTQIIRTLKSLERINRLGVKEFWINNAIGAAQSVEDKKAKVKSSE